MESKEVKAVEFQHGDDSYLAESDGYSYTVFSCDGDPIFTLNTPEIPDIQTLKALMCVYDRGYEAGREHGKFDIRYSLKQILDIK